MPCPHFWPIAPDSTRRVARAPLGVIHTGECTAGGQTADVELCNFGYARGVCAAFPADSAVDAVRFDGARYIYERDYSPVEFGDVAGVSNATVQRQFEVLSAWLKQIG
jgi:hypothetical protein